MNTQQNIAQEGAQQQTPQKKKIDLSTVKGFEQVWKNYEKTVMSLLVNKYGISVEEFMANAVNAVRKNPDLLKCTPKSLFGAMLLSAECGLKFNTPSQHAYIIPYKGEAQFQIGYQGLIEIMYRNPKVQKIDGHAVFDKDTFDYGYGLTPYLTHKPYRGSDKGALQCVYAVVKLHGSNEPIFTVVERKELEAIKNLSPAKNSSFSPYNSGTDVFNWMQIKASIKKISKLIPKTSEISKIIEIDDKVSSRFKATAEIIDNPEKIANVHFQEETIFGGAFDSYSVVETTKEEKTVNTTSTPTNEAIKPDESFDKKDETSEELNTKKVNKENSTDESSLQPKTEETAQVLEDLKHKGEEGTVIPKTINVVGKTITEENTGKAPNSTLFDE